jgi:hypothetical protein
VTKTPRKLLLSVALALVAGAACHADGLGYHECTEYLSYSSGWTDWQLSFDHYEPRLCPVDMDQPHIYLNTAATIIDDGTRDFASSELKITNTSYYILDDQFDYFHEHEASPYPQWVDEIYATYLVGTGLDECYDMFDYRMAARYYNSPGSLPSAQNHITYTYLPPGPPCP